MQNLSLSPVLQVVGLTTLVALVATIVGIVLSHIVRDTDKMGRHRPLAMRQTRIALWAASFAVILYFSAPYLLPAAPAVLDALLGKAWGVLMGVFVGTALVAGVAWEDSANRGPRFARLMMPWLLLGCLVMVVSTSHHYTVTDRVAAQWVAASQESDFDRALKNAGNQPRIARWVNDPSLRPAMIVVPDSTVVVKVPQGMRESSQNTAAMWWMVVLLLVALGVALRILSKKRPSTPEETVEEEEIALADGEGTIDFTVSYTPPNVSSGPSSDLGGDGDAEPAKKKKGFSFPKFGRKKK